MPDSGHNAYLTVRPDGTVDVPNNIDVNGVIAGALEDVIRYSDTPSPAFDLGGTLHLTGGEFDMYYDATGHWLEAVQVPHDLGRQPIGLMAIADVGGTGVRSFAVSTRNVDPDQFDAIAQVTDLAVSATPVACSYIAFG